MAEHPPETPEDLRIPPTWREEIPVDEKIEETLKRLRLEEGQKFPNLLRKNVDKKRLWTLDAVHLFPAESPEQLEENLHDLGELYMANFAPDEIFQKLDAFERLLKGKLERMYDPHHFDTLDDIVSRSKTEFIDELMAEHPEWNLEKFQRSLNGGGMLNRWDATPAERMRYRPGYLSPRDMMEQEFLGKSSLPGRFHVLGLRSPEGKLVSSVSYRLPPPPGAPLSEEAEYAAFLIQRFQKIRLHPPVTQQEPFPYLRKTMEVDTLNSLPDWKGVGTLQVVEMIGNIADQERERPPSHVFHCRFSGIAAAHHMSLEDAFMIGKNTPSAKLVKDCGFEDIGVQWPSDDLDIVAREIEKDVITAWVQWEYGWTSFDHLKTCVENRFARIAHW